MVRLINLDDDGEKAGPPLLSPPPYQATFSVIGSEVDRPNPNLNHKLPAALACYPIVSLLASYLDLTTLSELSRTCRQIYANLAQYRPLLVSQALRCINEKANPAQRLGNALHASHEVWTAYGRNGVKIGRITSGKVGACARDMVSECRNCGDIVCRNCIIKAPSTQTLRFRHRRLCRTCMKCPLDQLTTITRHIEEDGSFSPHPAPPPTTTTTSSLSETAPESKETRTYHRSPCMCEVNTPWICQPCGQTLRSDDTTYARGWTWRTRYSHCGGLGAGLGEGTSGVECGLATHCLASRLVETQSECSPSPSPSPSTAHDAAATAAEVPNDNDGRARNGSSYATQEVVGIGGKVKTKVKRSVRVGAVVKEYEEERREGGGNGEGEVLGREKAGLNRSWCSWCERVVVGKKDLDGAGMRRRRRRGSVESLGGSEGSV